MIKKIDLDPTISFIDQTDISRLLGENIVMMDITVLQKTLSLKYPQISDLRVRRRFPDTLELRAKKREPFLQAGVGEKILTLDRDGVLISTTTKQNDDFPLVLGLSSQTRHTLGLPVKTDKMRAALRIVAAFNSNNILNSFPVSHVDMMNLSKIKLLLPKDLTVIVDDDQLDHKIKLLGLVLTQGNLDLKAVKYIDMRFKEPVIGKK